MPGQRSAGAVSPARSQSDGDPATALPAVAALHTEGSCHHHDPGDMITAPASTLATASPKLGAWAGRRAAVARSRRNASEPV